MEFIANRKPNDYESIFYEFVLENHRDDLMEILRQPNPTAHYPLEVYFIQLPGNLCEKIYESPTSIFPEVDRAAHRALADLFEAQKDQESLVFKGHIHVRIHSMVEGASYRTIFPGSKDAGRFMALVGTIVRTSQPKLLEYKRFYRCNKCNNTMMVEAVQSRCYAFPKVDKCENQCVGAKIEQCDAGEGRNSATSYARVKDYQEVKLQEQLNSRTGFGSVPKALWVILENDLVDSCKPGDDVVITGTLFLNWSAFRKDQPINIEVKFMANHVAVKNDQRTSVLIGPDTLKQFEDFWARYESNPFEGRNAILRSICPQVYGMYLVKLAVCVVMAGGVSRENAGAKIRGESHLLLVGDPGTGKSQILKYASRITPRSVFTTGAGTTSAGLTVAAVKDGGEWHLEAGALVLADSGVCCIDEFSHIKEHDRTSIHEAMEQQSISIAKAGMVCKLNTKCTVIAATNPKMSKYDPRESLELNVGLASPLLSRFDLIIALKDAENGYWDEFLSNFILDDVDAYNYHAKSALKNGVIWDNDTVQSYLVLIKEKVPSMTEDAHLVLSKYFQHQRKSENRNSARTTVRLLESLYRLAEGHARLMYRDFVSVHDAVSAVTLVEASMQSSALQQNLQNSLHISFPENAYKEYYIQAKSILTTLQLPELWEREKIYLENLVQQNLRKPTSSMPPPPPPPSHSIHQRSCPVVKSNFPSSSSSSRLKMECDSSSDSPNVIAESIPIRTVAVSASATTSQSKQQQGFSRRIATSQNVSSQQQQGNNSWESPELFPDENNDKPLKVSSPRGYNNDDDIGRGAMTSTQNDDNVGAASRHPKCTNLFDNQDEFDLDICTPIPLIEDDGEQEYHPVAVGNLHSTPTQNSVQRNNGLAGSKRKRDVTTTETISPPQQRSSSRSDNIESSFTSRPSEYFNLQRYERMPNSQD